MAVAAGCTTPGFGFGEGGKMATWADKPFKKLRVGVGCRRGICEAAVVSAIRQVFADHALDLRAAAGVYSIDLKKDEPGLLAACRTLRLPAQFYSAQALAAVPGSCFGSEGYIRLSCCCSDADLKKGMDRMADFIGTL